MHGLYKASIVGAKENSMTRPTTLVTDEVVAEALMDAREAIVSLDEDAFGMAQIAFGEPGVDVYPIRDELLAKIERALASMPTVVTGELQPQGVGASVPDQALAVPVEPVARLDPTGFDPSRIAGMLTTEQRRALEGLGPKPSRLGTASGAETQCRLSAIKSCQYPLFEKTWAGDCNRYNLTALGIAVRDTLLLHESRGPSLDDALPWQIDLASAAVSANLTENGLPKYDSAQGYACALTAILMMEWADEEEAAHAIATETVQQGSVHEGAGPQDIAQKGSHD